AMSDTDPKSAQDLTAVVQSLLQQMQDKFQTITRIDDLEKNISDLMTQAGVEETEGENRATDASGTA
uniref:Heat shock factor binding protein 1a n=1 Tax=Electrophorus electricus TaxID=8005 RepID=A0A4W4GTS0_ELEEL